MMMAIRRSVGLPISFSMAFSYFSRIIPLVITSILQMIFIVIGFFLLIIPGIYLSLAYLFAVPLVVEKNLGPWQALETSRKAVTHRWFSIFGFFIVIGLMMLASMIPLGIGLIWTLPMGTVVYAVLYRTIFGVEAVKTI